MPTFVPNLAAPFKTVYIPIAPITAAGTAVVANAVYRIWMTTEPTDILSIQVVRQGGAATGSYLPGYIASTAATGALTGLAAAATTDTTTPGALSLNMDVPTVGGTDVSYPNTVPTGSVIGFTMGAVITSQLIQGVIIKYRSL
jgi:hypothetical protein